MHFVTTHPRTPSASDRPGAVLVLLVLFLALPAPACAIVCASPAITLAVDGIDPADPLLAAADPASWLARFEAAYESGDAVAYGALLADDFRFVFADSASRARFPAGFTREDELSSYTRLFRGAVTAEGVVLPRAASIDVSWDGVRVEADPAHPGDTGRAVVHVAVATLAIRFVDGTGVRDEAPHAFWLELAAGCGRDAPAWICHRWVERPDEPAVVALLADGDPAAEIVPAVGAGELATTPLWTAWPNPLHAGQALSFVYEVAEGGADVALELFDVTGRARATLDRGPRAAGRHLARWDGRSDAGVRLGAGVYFLRARVGGRVERERVILVR